MADEATEARIRDLKRRLERDPGSRLFVALAEEYRKTGRLAESVSTLQKGLLAHPHYLSARVALGRAYLEAGQITQAIDAFSKALAADRGNIISARSLADIYLSRGESVEAIKKYKLYRALSGDRKVDPIIERLQREIPPPPPAPVENPPQASPPPPFFGSKAPATAYPSRGAMAGEPPRAGTRTDVLDMTSVKFDPDESLPHAEEAAPLPMVSRDVPLGSAPREEPVRGEDFSTRGFRVAEVLGAPAQETRRPSGPGASAETESHADAEAARETLAAPQGRILADLYFVQGHYAEALRIYDDLVAADPSDPELKRLRRDAEARLLPAGSTARATDRGLERRLAKVRALKQWLSVIQAS